MKTLKSSTFAKVTAYILLAISSVTSLFSVLGVIVSIYFNFYNASYEALKPIFADPDTRITNIRLFIFHYCYEITALAAISLFVFFLCFFFLLTAAGHRKHKENITPNWLTAIPFDLLTFIVLTIGTILILLLDSFYNLTLLLYLIPFTACFTILTTVFLSDFVIRIKLGKLWKNTISYYTLRILWKIVCAFWAFNKEVFCSISILWKTAIIYVFVSLIEIFTFFLLLNDPEYFFYFWIFTKIIFLFFSLYITLILRKLQKAGGELAEGNLSYHTDTSKMFWDFKEHGEHLNSIALGMTKAVEEHLKSERLKTELITNVSHDIKTPLTSIINYSDLISKEECDNENIKEYSAALFRQSGRLKKLINDLMDVSKVRTGNIDVLLAPCETDVLLTQTIGEYEERLKNLELELIVKKPDEPLCIMADGRHIWRIFDNLMVNICKYAQSNTRVYLTLEKQNEKAVFSFKNTSHYALDISSDELMERFVRGDRSRNTEGSGLGLSIAQSLTKLQNGEFELIIDGDLFKVVMKFDTV